MCNTGECLPGFFWNSQHYVFTIAQLLQLLKFALTVGRCPETEYFNVNALLLTCKREVRDENTVFEHERLRLANKLPTFYGVAILQGNECLGEGLFDAAIKDGWRICWPPLSMGEWFFHVTVQRCFYWWQQREQRLIHDEAVRSLQKMHGRLSLNDGIRKCAAAFLLVPLM